MRMGPLGDFSLLWFSCPGAGLWLGEILHGLFRSETVGGTAPPPFFLKKKIIKVFQFCKFCKNLNCGYKPADSKSDVRYKIFRDALSNFASGTCLNFCV